MYQPKENEITFNVRPIGVKYICEHCGKGEMKLVCDPLNPFPKISSLDPLMKHRCTECNKELLLPKIYPYIEWVKEES